MTPLTYRTVWRWHFYAGLFSIPFVLWLSVTGSIYLFKPQIEHWLDRPFDTLHLAGPLHTPAQQAAAALAAVPGSTLHYFEIPETASSATRIIVGRGAQEFRVYLNPQTLAVLKVISEDRRPMRLVFRLHGELLAGDWGSRLVELAASWTIVLLLTGLFLWWPRGSARLAGVLYIRLHHGQRLFWRDLHAVTGVWISAFALFLLLTGLPWAKSWGTWFKTLRSLGSPNHLVRQDWSTGRSSEIDNRLALNRNSLAGLSLEDSNAMEHAGHIGHTMSMPTSPAALEPLNRLVPLVAAEHLAAPVLLMPPLPPASLWTARSDAQNRPLRATLTLDPGTGPGKNSTGSGSAPGAASGAASATRYAGPPRTPLASAPGTTASGQPARVVAREPFSHRPFLDRAVGIGVAAHEGQLFAPLNQLLGLVTALGLITLSCSAVVLWWQRRHTGVLGAPIPLGQPRLTPALAALILAFAIFLPLLGASLALVLLTERFILRRIPPAARWLGLQPT